MSFNDKHTSLFEFIVNKGKKSFKTFALVCKNKFKTFFALISKERIGWNF
jgi:hypothetical protein